VPGIDEQKRATDAIRFTIEEMRAHLSCGRCFLVQQARTFYKYWRNQFLVCLAAPDFGLFKSIPKTRMFRPSSNAGRGFVIATRRPYGHRYC
jgi:hypothetical protein